MKEIYEWLYDEYAEAALCQEPLFQDHVLEALGVEQGQAPHYRSR